MIGEPSLEIAQQEVDDRGKLHVRQGAEDDDLVDPIDELRPERTAQFS